MCSAERLLKPSPLEGHDGRDRRRGSVNSKRTKIPFPLRKLPNEVDAGHPGRMMFCWCRTVTLEAS
jgi:hypothetical protein